MEPGGTLSAVPSHDPGPGRDAARLAVRAFGLDETAHRRNGGGATIQILTGDCMDVLPTLPAQSVQCCVTSPPYWGLRDYGTAEWKGGDAGCDHKTDKANTRSFVNGQNGGGVNCTSWTTRDATPISGDCPKCGARRIDRQLGLESTPEEYLAKMVAVFREVWRVLRDDGTLWVDMGDSYAGGGGFSVTAPTTGESKSGKYGLTGALKQGGIKPTGSLKPKDLCMMPARLAIALQADGWYLRSDIIWHKPNPMPESCTDRPTKSHEFIFLLAKQERYFYDADAIREPYNPESVNRYKYSLDGTAPTSKQPGGDDDRRKREAHVRDPNPAGRNKRSVWTVATQPYAEAHFATFPEDLIKPCILAGSRAGDTVLDPFGGSGTTGKVAIELGRKAILIELNPDYVELAKERTDVTPAML